MLFIFLMKLPPLIISYVLAADLCMQKVSHPYFLMSQMLLSSRGNL